MFESLGKGHTDAVGDHLGHLEGRAGLSQREHREARRDSLWEEDRGREALPTAQARIEVRKSVPGLFFGRVQIAGWSFLVQDGELMIYEPDGVGDSEPITWETAERLMFVLQLVIETTRRNRGK